MIHHVIPKHEWKKRFGSLRGVNTPDNLVNLTTEQHVQVHQLLFEMSGNLFDKLAADGLSGIIGKEEIIRRSISIANKGVGRSLGYKHPIEQNLAQSERQRGTKRSEKTKQLMSLAQLGNRNVVGKKNALGSKHPQPKIECPHCATIGGSHAMKRYHFNNCKGKL